MGNNTAAQLKHFVPCVAVSFAEESKPKAQLLELGLNIGEFSFESSDPLLEPSTLSPGRFFAVQVKL